MDKAATEPPQAPPSAADQARAARLKALHEQVQRAEQALGAKRFGEAAGICQDVLEGAPEYPPALALLGAIFGHRGDLGRAVAHIEQALGRQPGVAAWHSNLSGLYRLLYRFDDAVTAAAEAVRLQPNVARFRVNLGKALMDRGERARAIEEFLAAIGLEAGHPEAHLAIGQILLASGEMKPGWVEDEWRNQLEQAKGMLPKMATPAWNGMRLPKDRVLLIGDQGYGDTLQFVRYAPQVAARCGEVVLGCSPDLAPLLRSVRGIATCHSRWDEIPPHRAHCLLSSLPGIFGTEIATIPTEIPYLGIDAALIRDWAERFEQALPPASLRIGVAWAGRPTHPNDRRRSMRLADFAPLAAVPGAVFVSLQHKFPSQDSAARETLPGMLDISEALTDFAATAAAIINLDLVVCVDTSVGHLAGALGKPVWLMLASPADWRWMLERTDTPWYPSMRLFRQGRPGDWQAVTSAVASSLASLPRRR